MAEEKEAEKLMAEKEGFEHLEYTNGRNRPISPCKNLHRTIFEHG
jgi:hypothetical protein